MKKKKKQDLFLSFWKIVSWMWDKKKGVWFYSWAAYAFKSCLIFFYSHFYLFLSFVVWLWNICNSNGCNVPLLLNINFSGCGCSWLRFPDRTISLVSVITAWKFSPLPGFYMAVGIAEIGTAFVPGGNICLFTARPYPGIPSAKFIGISVTWTVSVCHQCRYVFQPAVTNWRFLAGVSPPFSQVAVDRQRKKNVICSIVVSSNRCYSNSKRYNASSKI